jgi:hypothetical protein
MNNSSDIEFSTINEYNVLDQRYDKVNDKDRNYSKMIHNVNYETENLNLTSY